MISQLKWLTVCILAGGSQAQFTLDDFGDFFTAPLTSAPSSQSAPQPQFQPQPTPRAQFQPQPTPRAQFQPVTPQFRPQPAFTSQAGRTDSENPGFSFPAALPYVHDPSGDAPIRNAKQGRRNRPQQQQQRVQQPQQQFQQPQQPQQQFQQASQPQRQQQADQFTEARKQWEAQVAKHKHISQSHISKVNAIVKDHEKLHQNFLSSEEALDGQGFEQGLRPENNFIENNDNQKEQRTKTKELRPVKLSKFLAKTTRAPNDIKKSTPIDIPEDIVEDIEENIELIEELARAVNDLVVLADLLNDEPQRKTKKQSRAKHDREFRYRDEKRFRNEDYRIPQEIKERKNFIEKDREVLKKHRNVNTRNLDDELLGQNEAIANAVIDSIVDEQNQNEGKSKRIRNRGLNIQG